MNILIAGDFCTKNRVISKVESESFNELLGEVKPIIEQADYSIVNFECPVVNGKGNPIPKCGPNLRTTAKAVDLIKYAGFKAVTLANNHFLDYGEEGVHDTLEALDKAGIAHVGGGMNLAEASKTMYIGGDAGKVAIINCCEHEFSIATETTAGSNPLNPVQQWYAIQEARKKADYVIVIVHGGHEHYQLPSPRMQELYRYFIDCGADAVVNHHQHCYSGYEVYKEKPIFYGLGNFLFDNNKEGSHSIWNDGYLIALKLYGGVIVIDKLLPYTQCFNSLSVEPLKDYGVFKSKIDELNEIIEDKNELINHFKKLVEDKENGLRAAILPFKNKYLVAAANRGYIPTYVSQKKIMLLNNMIECESHRDTFLCFLNKESKTTKTTI